MTQRQRVPAVLIVLLVSATVFTVTAPAQSTRPTREQLEAAVGTIDAKSATLAERVTALRARIAEIDLSLQLLAKELADTKVEAAEADSRLATLAAERAELVRQLEALPTPMPFTAAYGFTPAGADPAVTLR